MPVSCDFPVQPIQQSGSLSSVFAITHIFNVNYYKLVLSFTISRRIISSLLSIFHFKRTSGIRTVHDIVAKGDLTSANLRCDESALLYSLKSNSSSLDMDSPSFELIFIFLELMLQFDRPKIMIFTWKFSFVQKSVCELKLEFDFHISIYFY